MLKRPKRLGDAAGGPDVPSYAATARCADFAGLPPAYIEIRQLDIFGDVEFHPPRRPARVRDHSARFGSCAGGPLPMRAGIRLNVALSVVIAAAAYARPAWLSQPNLFAFRPAGE